MHKVLSERRLIMTIFGYARVSTNGQNLATQESELLTAGCAKVCKEKVSGAMTDRAELAKARRRLEPGDVPIVTRLDRLARSTRDLLNIVAAIAEREAGFRSLKDTWADTARTVNISLPCGVVVRWQSPRQGPRRAIRTAGRTGPLL